LLLAACCLLLAAVSPPAAAAAVMPLMLLTALASVNTPSLSPVRLATERSACSHQRARAIAPLQTALQGARVPARCCGGIGDAQLESAKPRQTLMGFSACRFNFLSVKRQQ
jgi:hypothetical protein